jgi:uncharacterized membrane protein
MSNPIKFKLKNEWWPLLILAAVVIFSFWSYPFLPERVISHWNYAGQPDGYSSRAFQAWFFPILLVGIYALFLVMPLLDPKKERYAEFADVYNIFRNLIITVMAIVFGAATMFNLGWNVNIGAIVGGTIGIMMIVLGNYMGKIKRNWFVGIKTPWTLSSENVWNKTHRLGGRFFVAWGLVIIIAPWLPAYMALPLFIGGAVSAVIGTFIYSYIYYRQEKKAKK